MADGAYVEFEKLQARALKELDLTESERFVYSAFSDQVKCEKKWKEVSYKC